MKPFNLNTANKTDITFFLIVLALASSALAFFSFNWPLTQPSNTDVSYNQSGQFSYSATPPPGVYNSDRVQTGAPIFRALLNRFTANFDYNISAEAPLEVKGSYRLVAEISHKNGWSQTLILRPDTPFKGSTFSANSEVDLSAIQTRLDNLEQQTGLREQRYKLAIGPEISVKGILNGQAFQDTFSPRLIFDFDTIQLQLADTRLANPASDPLNPAQTGHVTLKTEAPSLISFLSFNPTVATTRKIAILGLVISLGGLLASGWFLFQAEQANETDQFQLKYGKLLINIQDPGSDISGDVVDVMTIEELARLAEQNGSMILHYIRREQHYYLVKAREMIYRYRIRQQPPLAKQAVPGRVR